MVVEKKLMLNYKGWGNDLALAVKRTHFFGLLTVLAQLILIAAVLCGMRNPSFGLGKRKNDIVVQHATNGTI